MKELPDYIAYKGDFYQIEFYFNEKGKSQPRDYVGEKLDREDAKKFIQLLVMMGDTGQIRNNEKFRNEGDKIYAFKPSPTDSYASFSTKEKSLSQTPSSRSSRNFLPPKRRKRYGASRTINRE